VPVKRSGDYMLNGKPFMLARGQFKGRAWRRNGLPNAVRPRATDADLQRNALPAEVDFVATYEDFSGGYGDAYRDPQTPNRIHWGENMETRFPRQAIHCQQATSLELAGGASAGNTSGRFEGANWIMQVPPTDTAAGLAPLGPLGRGHVLITGRAEPGDTFGYIETYTPTGLPRWAATEFDRVAEAELVATFTAFYGRPAIFGSFVWIGGDPQTTMPQFRRRDMRGLAGIAATTSPMNGTSFAVAGNALWRAHGPSGGHVNLIQRCGVGTDPMGTANWGPTFNLGNGQTDIQDIVALDDQLFVGMQDGLYAGDVSATFYNVLGDMTGQIHPDNGRNLTVHQRGIVYPYTGGLLYYQKLATAAIARDISPNQNSQRSPLRGHFRAVTSYGGWLYGGLYSGSSSYVVAGREDANGVYAWHPLQRLPTLVQSGSDGNAIHQIAVDSISAPSGGGIVASGNALLPSRFWVSTSASFGPLSTLAAPVFYWQAPPGDINPLGAPGFSGNYMGSARVDFGRDNRGAPETLKVLRRLDVNTDANTLLSGVRYADLYYALDGGTRTLLGRVQTSPRTTLYFPSAAGSFTTCYDFELSLESFSGPVGATASVYGIIANTPVYRSLVLHGAFLSEGSDQITAVTRVADNMRDLTGAPMRSGAQQLAELRGLAGTAPVLLTDLTGATNWVTIQRDIEENETYQEGSDYPEIAATVKMAVLSFTGG
jgi:hypothetical protein